MSKKNSKNKVSAWVVVGVIVLIILIFGWQTCATEAGDTDVSTYSNFQQDQQVENVDNGVQNGTPVNNAASQNPVSSNTSVAL